VNYRIDGNGDRIVLLACALGTTVELWEPQLPALTPRFRVLRYEPVMPFDSVVALLDELDLEHVSFCGLSLGGVVGMWLALEQPERIERLVLCATSPRFATPGYWEERAKLVAQGGLDAVADVTLERWFTPRFTDVRRYREMLLSTSPKAYIQGCTALRDWDVRGRLYPITAPTLAIAADDDPSTPPADLEAIAGEIPGARLELIHGARHLPNVERPAEFNALLLTHL
jgi:3-oxoadipate enol-lactonase